MQGAQVRSLVRELRSQMMLQRLGPCTTRARTLHRRIPCATTKPRHRRQMETQTRKLTLKTKSHLI